MSITTPPADAAVDDAGDEGIWLDENEYPTTWGLRQLAGHHGTPQALAEMLGKLWWPPTPIRIQHTIDTVLGKPVVRVELVTGGWSGNEEVIDALRNTMWHILWWESSHRGGLHVYQVPVEAWDTWTLIPLAPGAGSGTA